MAAKTWGGVAQKAIEEVFFQNDAVSLCLLINRRARTMRVIDFRAGPSNAKRLFVMSLAQREGADKVFTLVERDEVSTWVKLGFAKEGNVPGFYKRSDAFFLGAMVPPYAESMSSGRSDEEPPDSDVRLAQRPEALSPAMERMERTVAKGKRLAKEHGERALPSVKVTAVHESDTTKAVTLALRTGRALTGFEAFGRDAERNYFVLTARGGFELVVSTDAQGCFGNAFVELLSSPRTEAERLATTAGLRVLFEKLLEGGVAGCFALAPSDDVALAAAFTFSGFRRTGLLHGQLVVGGERKDAILWARKLSNPTDE